MQTRPCLDGGDIDALAVELRPTSSPRRLIRIGMKVACDAQGIKIGIDHFCNEIGKGGAMQPAELLPRLARIALQHIDFGRPK